MSTFRVTFSKDDVLVYISHLDLNHAFIRARNRADIQLVYSQGFNPHPKLVFALPLSIGMAGENELLDIGVLDESVTAERLREALCEQLPPHITVKNVELAERKLKDVSSALYEIVISKSVIADALKELLGGTITVRKKTKSGEKDVVISDGIIKTALREVENTTVIDAVLSASGDNYLNPELIIKAATEKGILSESDAVAITRKRILFGKEMPEI